MTKPRRSYAISEHLEQIEDLYLSGVPPRVIAERLGIDRRSLNNRLSTLGLPDVKRERDLDLVDEVFGKEVT